MSYAKLSYTLVFVLFFNINSQAQVVINEGSNKNYSTLTDKDGDYPDWVELYNPGGQTISLENYTITDNASKPTKWKFPNVVIEPHRYLLVFCSGKDEFPTAGFTDVLQEQNYVPEVGWNNHQFAVPFYWDGTSGILINTCSYSSLGYTSNSVFNQTSTSFLSTNFAFQDGSDAVCSTKYGSPAFLRPNLKLNGLNIGNGNIQNSTTGYPAPYGNWYWCARHQMLVLPSELTAAGLTSGYISSIAFDVVSTDPNTRYDYINFSMKLVDKTTVTSEFEPSEPSAELHTSFKISEDGETVYLFSPSQTELSNLVVDARDPDISCGSNPDGSTNKYFFQYPTPGSSNNDAEAFTEFLDKPAFSVPSGYYDEPVNLQITNPNGSESAIYYTTDGSDPTTESQLYYENYPIEISSTVVLKAKSFQAGKLPSRVKASTYFFGINHSTPVVSVITENSNLYGESGIFDNWWQDWERPSYVEYFDSTTQLIFSQRAGIQIDGGWGGSRHLPQHSFRVELDDGVLGDGKVDYELIPDRSERETWNKFYLRNGSNQNLILPYKDACQVSAMSNGSKNYYSAMRPVSVYINGSYFGLYELREKFDVDYFEILDGADPDKTDILSQSAWYGGVLRVVEGSVEPFFSSLAAVSELNPADTTFWAEADAYFDMTWYTDYIIGESWMGNTDWPWNNIKIYRSDASDFRWRYCLIDQELAMLPNGWTDKNFDHIEFMLNYDPSNPYISLWQKGIQNDKFRNYFINRFADQMNTVYLQTRLSGIESNMYSLVREEMENEFTRWGDPNNVPEQMDQFDLNHVTFKFQLMGRSAQVRNHLMNHFNLPNKVDVTLDVYPPESGTIHISTVMSYDYPWQGVYFNGLPVSITAEPAAGFTFSYWKSNGLIADTLNPVFLDTLKANEALFLAVFEDITTRIITNNDGIQSFSCYPNPANNVIYIKGLQLNNAVYQVIGMNGKILEEGKIYSNGNATAVSVGSLPPSFYLIRIIDPKNGVMQSRFVKSGAVSH